MSAGIASQRITKKDWLNLALLPLGIILMAIGIYFGGIGFVKTVLISSAVSNDSGAVLASPKPVEPTPEPLISGIPASIQLPSVGIDLKVVPGEYNAATKSWTLSLKSAHWGVISAQPNNKEGLTFIYAHNRTNVFNTLPKIKPGDKARVQSEDGTYFVYTFVSSTETLPEDTSLFDYKGKPILVLQTCSGRWYEKRQLFVFEFSEVFAAHT